ncbi:MAG: hypothetical protein ACI9XJ_002544 [Marivirga sp.]|jgi:hypothetical protein
MSPGHRIISIYKTNLTENNLVDLKRSLDSSENVVKWNTDLEDCDNILRIESHHSIEKEIIGILYAINIKCIELQ